MIELTGEDVMIGDRYDAQTQREADARVTI